MRLVSTVFLITLALTFTGCARTSDMRQGNVNLASRVYSDSEISFGIERKLYDAGLRDIEVQTESGNVMLCGYVETLDQRFEAEEIARQSGGVIGLDNRIVVGKRPPVNINKPGGPRGKPCEF